MSKKTIWDTRGHMLGYEREDGSWLIDQTQIDENRHRVEEKRNSSSGGGVMPDWAASIMIPIWTTAILFGAIILVYAFFGTGVFFVITTTICSIIWLGVIIYIIYNALTGSGSGRKRRSAADAYREEMRRRRYGQKK